MAEERLELLVEIRDAIRDLKKFEDNVDETMEGSSKSAKKLGGSLDKLKNSLAAVAGTLGLGMLIKSSGEAALEMERLNRILDPEQVAFLRQESQRLGLVFNDMADQFRQFAAATRGTALEGEAAEEIFSGIGEALTIMGASGEQAQRAFLAVQQIAAKGVVSMEELRRQLGEALPQAATALALGLGVSKQEMTELVESGSLLAEDALPAMVRGLREMGEGLEDAMGSAQANINRVRSALFELRAAAGEGFLDNVSDAAQLSAEELTRLKNAARAAGEGLGGLIKVGTDLAKALSDVGEAAGRAAAGLHDASPEATDIALLQEYGDRHDVILELLSEGTPEAARKAERALLLMAGTLQEMGKLSGDNAQMVVELAGAIADDLREAGEETTPALERLFEMLAPMEEAGKGAAEGILATAEALDQLRKEGEAANKAIDDVLITEEDTRDLEQATGAIVSLFKAMQAGVSDVNVDQDALKEKVQELLDEYERVGEVVPDSLKGVSDALDVVSSSTEKVQKATEKKSKSDKEAVQSALDLADANREEAEALLELSDAQLELDRARGQVSEQESEVRQLEDEVEALQRKQETQALTIEESEKLFQAENELREEKAKLNDQHEREEEALEGVREEREKLIQQAKGEQKKSIEEQIELVEKLTEAYQEHKEVVERAEKATASFREEVTLLGTEMETTLDVCERLKECLASQ